MPDDGPGDLHYWAARAAPDAPVVGGDQRIPAYRGAPRTGPPYAAPHAASAAPARFSSLCAGALTAGICALAAIVVQRDIDGVAGSASILAVLLSIAALVKTSAERITNRWMAVVPLAVAFVLLLPLVLIWLFFAYLLRDGLYG